MTADKSIDDRARCGVSTSRSLLADVQQDDQAAWGRLVHLYAPLVAAWCRRLGVAEQDVVDILQEVFAAVASNLVRFRKERPHDTFRGWLSTITRNKVRDYFRRRADRPAAVGGTEASLRLAQAPDVQAIAREFDAAEDAAFSEVLQRARRADSWGVSGTNVASVLERGC